MSMSNAIANDPEKTAEFFFGEVTQLVKAETGPADPLRLKARFTPKNNQSIDVWLTPKAVYGLRKSALAHAKASDTMSSVVEKLWSKVDRMKYDDPHREKVFQEIEALYKLAVIELAQLHSLAGSLVHAGAAEIAEYEGSYRLVTFSAVGIV